MVVVGDVGIRDAPRLHEENQGFVSDTEVERGARLRVAPEVLKDKLVYASLTGEGVVASFRSAPRVHKGAPCSAKHMVAESVAYSKAAPRVPKEAHPSARVTVGESVASLMAEAFARKVFMGAQTFALLTVVGRDVLCQAAQKVHEDALIVASGMVEESVAGLRIVGRVHKAARISARPTEEARGATGERANARSLQEAGVVFVQPTAACCRSESRAKEASLGQDSFTGLYLRLAAITMLFRESVSSLIVLIHRKSQQKDNN